MWNLSLVSINHEFGIGNWVILAVYSGCAKEHGYARSMMTRGKPRDEGIGIFCRNSASIQGRIGHVRNTFWISSPAVPRSGCVSGILRIRIDPYDTPTVIARAEIRSWHRRFDGNPRQRQDIIAAAYSATSVERGPRDRLFRCQPGIVHRSDWRPVAGFSHESRQRKYHKVKHRKYSAADDAIDRDGTYEANSGTLGTNSVVD